MNKLILIPRGEKQRSEIQPIGINGMFPLLFLLDMEIWLTEANLEETNVVQFIVIRDCKSKKRQT